MLKEALFYKKLKSKTIQCKLCPHECKLRPNQLGKCKVRRNIKGKLISENYGKLISSNPDYIQKKPFYHFLPNTLSYSIATVGCNLACQHCQNWQISQSAVNDIPVQLSKPEEVIKDAIKTNCKSISYTYTEPTIQYEFMIDTAKLAKKNKLKNCIISNGFIREEPLKKLCKYIDAANIDLKAFNEEFYKKTCFGQLKPVLKSLRVLKKSKIHLEITNLIIPEKNDDLKEIEDMCKWIKTNLGENIPLHFSRFFPYYKSSNLSPTPIETLKKASEIAKKYLNHIYLGNILLKEANNTYCPKCQKLLIERTQLDLVKNNLKKNKCPDCKTKIYGVWQ